MSEPKAGQSRAVGEQEIRKKNSTLNVIILQVK